MFWKRFVLSCVAMVAAFSVFGCGGSSKSPSVAVTASVTTVDATDTVTLTATVTNDSTTGGVTWTVSGGGSLSNTTTISATFTAPAATTSAQTITVTATSVADTTKTGTVTLTVPAKLTVTSTATQLTGAIGAAYSVQLTTSAGISPYKWTLDPTSAALPTGWNLSSSGLLTGSAPMAAQAGTYDIVFDVSDSGTPTPMTASQSLVLTITPAPAIVFGGVMPATATYNTAYAGSAAAAGGVGTLTYSATGLPAGLLLNTATGAVTGTPTVVGTFSPSVTAADAFGDSKTQAYTITVGQATPALTFAAIPTETYGNAPFTVSASSASSGAITYSVTSGPATISGATVTLTGAGTVVLGAIQAATTDYTAPAPATASITVNKATATIKVTPYTVTYDGNPHTATATSTGVGGVALSASDVTLTNTTHANAGTYASDAWSFTDPSGNYLNASGTVTDTISQAVAAVTITPYSMTYDGNPHTATATATGVGGVTLSASDLTLTGTTHTNAGTYASDAWSFADPNYVSQSGTVSDKISQATATVTVTPYSVTYDGNAHTATATATGVGGVTLSASDLTLTGTTHTNAGTYPSDAWSFADPDYVSQNGTVSDSIAKATATISVTPYSVTYDGNAHTATATATGTGGSNLAADLNLTGTTHTNVGTYASDAWSFADPNGNYVSQNGTVSDSITKATATITVTPYSVTYDGNPHTAAGTATGAGGSNLAADLNLTGTTHTNVGAYTSDAWTFTDATGNYNNASGTVSDSITKATATINVTPYNVIYDGNPHTATGTATGVAGAILNADLNLTGTTHTAIGTYAGDPWTFTDATGNYNNANGTVDDTINATLAIQTTTLSPNYVYTGSSFSQTLTAVGGATPYTWSVAAGSSLPSWLNLSPSTGVLSGTVPSNATLGSDNFTLQVKDANNNTTPQTYTLTVYGALALAPVSGVLAPATTGETYSGATITASGGSGTYTWTVGTGLPSGMTATPSGGTLSISGTAPSTPQTLSFTVTLTDTATNQSHGPISYSIVVSSPTPLALTPSPSPLPTGTVGQNYNGTITASGGSGTYTSFQVMVGSTLTTVPSSGNGQLLVANGISVSMNGANELIVSGTPMTATPVALDVTVNDSASGTLTQDYTITIVNPAAGFTVSGTVSYSGSLTGWVYLQLVNTNCTNCDGNLGTAINATTAGALTSGKAFTINGVPPGTYTLQAYMDNTSTDSTSGEVMGGYGARNASNPAGVDGSNITVSSGPATGANVTLNPPTTPTLGTTTPTWNSGNGFGVFSGGAMVSFSPICNGGGCNNGGIEIPNSYLVQWSADSSFGTVAGSQCFPATGGQNPWIVSGISGTGPYYFRAAGVLGSCHSGTVGNYSAASPSAYTIANPTAGNQVTSTVSWAGTATGPLYVGFYDQSTGNVYLTVVGSKTSPPTSGVSYSLYVPTGSNYVNFGLVDQKNDGLFVPGDISNTNEKLNQAIAISGATNLGNLALPSGNGMASVSTNSNQQTDISGNVNTGYGLNLRVMGLLKQPASVELYSGPSYLQVTPPADIATAAFNGNTDEWDYYPNTNGGTPSTSDVFTFNVTYTDGSSNSTANSPSNPLTGSPSAVLSAWTTNMLPDWNTTGVSTTPNFSWSYPSGASAYTYQFQLQDSSGNTIWSIPTQHSQSSGFASTISPSITWNIDPTGGGSTPSSSSLSSSTTYIWQIQATDADGNQATTQMAFQTAASALTLPASGPGNALVSTPYGATINASGGSGSYAFTVNGVTIPTNMAYTAVTNADGLTFANSSGNTLWIGGTPTTTGSFPISVTVTDSASDNASQNYTINVVGAPSGVNNANLNGTYVCKVDSFNDSDGARWVSLSSLVANGSGGITSGVWDMNARDLSAAMGGTITSTSAYNVGADNNGILTINTTQTTGGSGTHSSQFAIALNNTGTSGTVASEFRMVETDDVGATPSGQHGVGDCYLASTGAFAASTLSGKSFAMGIQGEDGSGVPKAFVGRFTNSTESTTGGTGGAAGGSISSGYIDGMKLSQTTDQGGAFTGSYTAPSNTTGRYTFTITLGSKTLNFAGYIIDANRMFLLETDAASTNGMMAGDMRTQQQSSYSAANLDGAAVLYGQAFSGYSGSSVTGYDSQVFQTSSTGNGTLTVDQSYDNNQGTYAAGAENGASVAITFDSANPGRATFSPGGSGESAFLYFFNTNDAFYLDLNGTQAYLETGWLEPQSGTFTNAGLAGSYMLGTLPPMNTNKNDSAGELAVSNTGSITANITNAGQGEFTWDQAQSGLSYSWLSSIYGSYSLSGTGGGGSTCVVISATKSICMDNTDSNANMVSLQQ